MSDHSHLQRFVAAQQPCYDQVCAELRAGRKQTHWMWFIFPQIRGLGTSPFAQRFAIDSLDEAAAYLDHPLLGTRLRECTGLVLAIRSRSAEQIFGDIDSMKFRSSMTLFARVGGENNLFVSALHNFYEGVEDPLTLEQLQPA